MFGLPDTICNLDKYGFVKLIIEEKYKGTEYDETANSISFKLPSDFTKFTVKKINSTLPSTNSPLPSTTLQVSAGKTIQFDLVKKKNTFDNIKMYFFSESFKLICDTSTKVYELFDLIALAKEARFYQQKVQKMIQNEKDAVDAADAAEVEEFDVNGYPIARPPKGALGLGFFGLGGGKLVGGKRSRSRARSRSPKRQMRRVSRGGSRMPRK